MNLVDRLFRISIILKGLDGLLETVAGILLLVVGSESVVDLAQTLTGTVARTAPQGWLASAVVHGATQLVGGASVFAALYLLAHGVVKLVLVVAVLRDKLWAFPWMMAFLAAFVAYQSYQMAVTFSVGLLLLTAFDLVIIALTHIEYRKRKAVRAERREVLVSHG